MTFVADAVQIRARHFAVLFLLSLATLQLELALNPNIVCVGVVSLWLSAYIDGATWLRSLGSNFCTLGGPRGKDLDLWLGICGLAHLVCTVDRLLLLAKGSTLVRCKIEELAAGIDARFTTQRSLHPPA